MARATLRKQKTPPLAKAYWPFSSLHLLKPDWRTLLAGALIVFSFPPWNIHPLIWIALTPWFFALDRAKTSRDAFIQGIWLSFAMTLGGFYWVASVLHEFANVPWPVGILGLVLFALVGQPQFLIFAPIQTWIFRTERTLKPGAAAALGLALAGALLYAGIDWILPKLWVDTLGHSQYLSTHLRQVADLGGATLLTFLIFFTNQAIWRCLDYWLRRKDPRSQGLARLSGVQLGAALLGISLCWVYGHFRGQAIQALIAHPELEVQAAAIQGNIGDFDKLASEKGIRGAGDKVLSTYFSLSDRALLMEQKPEFIVWPETAYPSTFRTPMTSDELFRDQRVESYVRDRKVPLLFGGYDRKGGKDFNAFFLLSPRTEGGSAPEAGFRGGDDLQIYRKHVLLLFGEYIPGAEYITPLKEAFPQVGNFGRGPGPEVLSVPIASRPGVSVKLGPIICYEALFPNYVIAAARKGSQLILNITNDSWFGTAGEPYLHLSLTVFRSIETRLPQFRATNTGISALILPDGEISRQTRIDEPEIMNVKIPILPPVWTLMIAWGDWFGYFGLVLGGLGIGLAEWRKRSLKNAGVSGATHPPTG